MNIRWENYKRVERFSIRQAAFLWLEREPEKDELNTPPLDITLMEQSIVAELGKIERQKEKEVLQDWIKKTGKTRADFIDEEISQVRLLMLQGEFATSSTEVSQEQMAIKKEKILKTSISPLERTQHILTPRYQSDSVSREKLMKVAENWNEKPKFLFPEVRVDDSSEVIETDDKPMSTKERNSYLKLIKALLQKQGINPAERGIAKQLVGYIKDANQSLGDDKVREILKEVQNLAED